MEKTSSFFWMIRERIIHCSCAKHLVQETLWLCSNTCHITSSAPNLYKGGWKAVVCLQKEQLSGEHPYLAFHTCRPSRYCVKGISDRRWSKGKYISWMRRRPNYKTENMQLIIVQSETWDSKVQAKSSTVRLGGMQGQIKGVVLLLMLMLLNLLFS